MRTGGHALRAVEDAFIRRDGTMFPVTYSAAPLADAGSGRGLVVVFRDATMERAEQLRAPHELKRCEVAGKNAGG